MDSLLGNLKGQLLLLIASALMRGAPAAMNAQDVTMLRNQDPRRMEEMKRRMAAADVPFFVHRATPQNVMRNWTVIDSRFTNGEPNAILIVTPNWNPGGAGGVYDNHAIGVWYTDGHWAIFNQDLVPMPAGAGFNVAVMIPDKLAAASASPPASTLLERKVNAVGRVEVQRADGSTKILFDGGYTIVAPDGRQSTAVFQQVQPPTPPALPSEPAIVTWLETHNQNLLSIMAAVASDGQTSVDNYLRAEEPGLSLYKRIARRSLFIERMFAE